MQEGCSCMRICAIDVLLESASSKMRHDLHKMKNELCRSHPTVFPNRASLFKSILDSVFEELSMCCCNKYRQTNGQVKNVVLTVFRFLEKD